MTPSFQWTADLNDTSRGTATFTVAGVTHSVPLPSFSEAFLLHQLMQQAYNHGQACGQRALAQLLVGTVAPYR